MLQVNFTGYIVFPLLNLHTSGIYNKLYIKPLTIVRHISHVNWKQKPKQLNTILKLCTTTQTLNKTLVDLCNVLKEETDRCHVISCRTSSFFPDFFTPPDNYHRLHIIFLWYKMDDKADDFIWGKYCFVYYVFTQV